LASIKRARFVYAPSRFVAAHLQQRYGRRIGVVYPPVFSEPEENELPDRPLPDRYFVHFGQLRTRKGTEWLAEALLLAWAEEPALTMLWIGPAEKASVERWYARWAEHGRNVTYYGALPRPQLHAILRRASAAVLPSIVDNLPNTVIESLLAGVPVIGSAGASIDELVQPGITGELVPILDTPALAAAMVRVWRGQTSAAPGFTWTSATRTEMSPPVAVGNLLRFAGLS